MADVAEHDSLILTNAKLVLPGGAVEKGSIALNGDRIVSIQEGPSTLPGLDLSGATLFPGFIDVHIHGVAGVDTMEATADVLREAASFLATEGVTSWLPTLVPATGEKYESAVTAVEQLLIEQRASSQSPVARPLGVHYEGPFVNSKQCGALHVEHFRTFANEHQLDRLPSIKTEGARMMMTFAPEIEGGIELAQTLHNRGWVASIGHSRSSIEVLDCALRAGANHMTHFMNAMTPLHHRSPGPIAWGLMNDEVTCDIIADGHHLDPYTLRLLMKLKGSAGLCLISDAIAATGKGDGDYEIWGETITVKGGRTSNAKGSIAGSIITMLDAVRMMRSLGVSDVEVARMASSNPARLLRLDRELGSIEEGKRADLVALDDEGNVRLTIVGGQIAFQVGA